MKAKFGKIQGKEGGGAPGQDNDVKILLIDDAAQVEIYQVSVIPVALYIIKHDTFCFFSKLSRVNCQDIMVLIIYGIVYRLNPFYCIFWNISWNVEELSYSSIIQATLRGSGLLQAGQIRSGRHFEKS